jgi:hypothetical protein
VVELNVSAMVFNGVYRDYDLQDHLVEEGYFNQGVKRGLVNEYFIDRTIKSTIDYTENDFVIWQLKGDAKEDVILNGSGKFMRTYFYIVGTTLQPRLKQGTLSGEFKMGKRFGTWFYHDLNKTKTDEEFYEEGKLVKRIHNEADGTSLELAYKKEIIISIGSLAEEAMVFDANAYGILNSSFEQNISYPAKFNRPATYAGGLKKMLLLIKKNNPLPEGTALVVRATINERGYLTSCEGESALSRAVNDRAAAMVRSHEKIFFPAIRNGKPISSKLFLLVYGGEEGMKLINELPFDFTQEEE